MLLGSRALAAALQLQLLRVAVRGTFGKKLTGEAR
jgi:hypothetical protein